MMNPNRTEQQIQNVPRHPFIVEHRISSLVALVCNGVYAFLFGLDAISTVYAFTFLSGHEMNPLGWPGAFFASFPFLVFCTVFNVYGLFYGSLGRRAVLFNAGLMLFFAFFHLAAGLNNVSEIIRFVRSFP